MALTDQSTRIRSGEELDAAVIDAYLKANIPGLSGEAKISQFPGGASNLTYLIEYPPPAFVLRRPPFGHKAKSAHDMGREYRILNQLNAGFPYCPKAYAVSYTHLRIGLGHPAVATGGQRILVVQRGIAHADQQFALRQLLDVALDDFTLEACLLYTSEQGVPVQMPDSLTAFGINGGLKNGLAGLLMTHPPLEDRIEALRRLG